MLCLNNNYRQTSFTHQSLFLVKKKTHWPNIWSVLLPTLFPGSTLLTGPKHSTSVSSSREVAVPLSVDEKEVAFVPNPVPDLAVKTSLGPQIEEGFDLCTRVHSLLPPTLQLVVPLMSPLTVQVKLKVSPGQVGGGAVSCPATSPVWK